MQRLNGDRGLRDFADAGAPAQANDELHQGAATVQRGLRAQAGALPRERSAPTPRIRNYQAPQPPNSTRQVGLHSAAEGTDGRSGAQTQTAQANAPSLELLQNVSNILKEAPEELGR